MGGRLGGAAGGGGGSATVIATPPPRWRSLDFPQWAGGPGPSAGMAVWLVIGIFLDGAGPGTASGPGYKRALS